ncbi:MULTISPECIES: hypothetical protein [unclassified Methylobacterium]|uniref:hypothetical protein n=1 Tax=unclassified Methylobacterium TaxID=2615210 RepID=UPI0006FEDA47|nr:MULTISPECIES: hypothetical protein [unclassified Methylobacterium]KQP89767.1 hypothetical protein ASF60_18720 [Methylobacterium sp. Leaf113]MCK2056212.1 hypothetical protein [Methylobacterium sp. 37f]
MTKDVQHDRPDSPLASVSDEIFPQTLSRKPDTPADDIASNPVACEPPSTFDSDSFEGFGSFG